MLQKEVAPLEERLHLSVPGGGAHTLSLHAVASMQEAVAELGAETSPLLLRLGGGAGLLLQPVTARALLGELERAVPLLALQQIPGLRFEGEGGSELGGLYVRRGGRPLGAADDVELSVSAEGIRVLMRRVPPPIGFRSAPGLRAGLYVCHFDSLVPQEAGWLGYRTAAMGGSGSPVPLPALPLPPVTRWDFARVAGRPVISRVVFHVSTAAEVYRQVIHAIDSACHDSIRLKAPLQVRVE